MHYTVTEELEGDSPKVFTDVQIRVPPTTNYIYHNHHDGDEHHGNHHYHT